MQVRGAAEAQQDKVQVVNGVATLDVSQAALHVHQSESVLALDRAPARAGDALPHTDKEPQPVHVDTGVDSTVADDLVGRVCSVVQACNQEELVVAQLAMVCASTQAAVDSQAEHRVALVHTDPWQQAQEVL